MNIQILSSLINNDGIKAIEFIDNNKASERYVRVVFQQADGFKWETVVPYYCRRSGLSIDTDTELATYLISIKPYFTKRNMAKWRKAERAKWEKNNADVTKEFFFVLLSFKEETEFPTNDNPARRIQDIKDAGYTLASIPNKVNRKTSRILLPIPLNNKMGYETFTPQFKARVIRLLHGINAFEAKPTSKGSLIPDHKFSEVRWDDETKAENSMDMTDSEVVAKFQLLDNQRNQQKREICRKCFQEGIRGQIYGIDFYAKGTREWDKNIPIVGKKAEEGCTGCPWYDIEAWRKALNRLLNNDNK